MNALYLIAVIDGSRVAIQSDLVEAVVRVNDVIPVPKSNPSVAGLFALRSRRAPPMTPRRCRTCGMTAINAKANLILSWRC